MASHNVEVLDNFLPHGVMAAPIGCCYRCHTDRRVISPEGAKEKVLDLGVWIEMEGKLLICQTCGDEIARALGYVAPAKADELRRSNRELGMANARLTKQLAATVDALAALK